MRPTCTYVLKASNLNRFECSQCGHVVYTQYTDQSKLVHACPRGALRNAVQTTHSTEPFYRLIAEAYQRHTNESREWGELVQLARHVIIQGLWKGCSERFNSTVTWLLQKDKWPGWWGPKPEVWPYDGRVRILHVMSWPLQIGGASRMMHEWCKRKKDVWDIHVLTCSGPGPWDWTGITMHTGIEKDKLAARAQAIAADVVVNHTPFESVTQDITAPQVWIMHGMPFLRKPPPRGVKPVCVFSNLDTEEIHPDWKQLNWNVLPVGIDLDKYLP